MLQDKLSHLQDEFTQTESECVTLRNMVEERDVFITTMKSEIYRKEYKSDTEKVELRNQLMLKDASIKKLEVCCDGCNQQVLSRVSSFVILFLQVFWDVLAALVCILLPRLIGLPVLLIGVWQKWDSWKTWLLSLCIYLASTGWHYCITDDFFHSSQAKTNCTVEWGLKHIFTRFSLITFIYPIHGMQALRVSVAAAAGIDVSCSFLFLLSLSSINGSFLTPLQGVVKETADSQLAQYHDISSQLQEKEEVETALTAELSTLKEDVSRLTEVESALEGKLSTRERRIVHLEDKIADMQYELRSRRVDLTPEDVDNVHECLGQLRSSLAPQDQQQRLLDALEQMISDLIGRMMERTVSPSGKRRRQRDSEEHYRDRDRDRERDRDRDRDRGDRDRDRDRDKDRRRRHREKHGASHNGPSSGGGGDLGNPTTPTDKAPGVFNGEMTKVFCYMLSDKTETPYVTLVPSSLASK